MFKKIFYVLSVLVILSLALTGAGLAAEDVQTAADAYFSGGTQNIRAADLFDVLNDGDTSNDPVILDLRAADDFAAGHIPGAINVGVKQLFTADQLAELDGKEVVTYCYTGQTSSQATSALNMLGISAKSMLFGFPAWANVEVVAGQAPFDRAVDGHDYKVSTEAAEATDEFDPPASPAESVAGAAEAYFSNGTKNISASALFDNLNDGDASNDPFMIDVRSAEDYAAGHIPGAVHMDAKAMFAAENLAKIPADQPIVVNCYTGQTASQVTSALNMLGYDATNLKFGFASWSPSGNYSFNAASDSGNYRIEGAAAEMEAAEATMAEAEPAVEEEAAVVAEEAAPAAEPQAAPAEQPTQLPATGGIPVDFTLIYVLVGSGLVGTGLYLRRR